MVKRVYFLLILAYLLFGVCVSFASNFTGKAVKVTDGDTIQVMHDGVAEKIRLDGIDCPESGQAYGQKAKEFTADLVATKIVTVEVKTKDRYGRTVGEVFLSDGTSLNQEIVKAGYAWHYKKYSSDPTLAQLEVDARLSAKGLWRDPHPVAPWDYRNGKKSSSYESQQEGLKTVVASAGGTVHGNTDSRIYHQSWCRWYNCKNCSAVFGSASEAERAGYRGCKKCN